MKRGAYISLAAGAAAVCALGFIALSPERGDDSGARDARWNQVVNLLVADLRASVAEMGGQLAGEDVEDALETGPAFEDALANIREHNALVLATTNEPTTYFVGRQGPKGFEYELARGYAEHLGVGLDIEVLPTAAAVMDAVEDGRAHIGAAHLKRTPRNEDLVTFGPTFLTTSERLVCEVDGESPSEPGQLEGVEILIPEDSPFEETLQERRDEGWPVQWDSTAAVTSELLAAVADHRTDCTVADEQVFEVNRRYFPNLVSDMQITADRGIAWALPGDGEGVSRALRQNIAAWLESDEGQLLLADLNDAYFAYYEEFDYVDLQRFRRAIAERLPQYRDLFERFGVEENIDWRLLAAVAWQESRWNPGAVSPTGVRGLMMLTRATAREVGIDDRTDPTDAVEGGAEYLAQMRKRVPEDVVDRDEWWFATASYNVGLGHVLDARRLAESLERDEDRWRYVRETLPLLEDPEWYRANVVRYGYARGREPVRYVRRIRAFFDILEKRFPDAAEPIQTAELRGSAD